MSFKTTLQQTSTINARHTNPDALPLGRTAPQPWVRNPSWLPMPTVLPTEQKVVSLFAVFPSFSSVAMTNAGAYAVDWGDGSAISNVPSGVSTTKNYDYNSSALDGTNAPVTFTASTSTVNRTAHGYTDDMNVQFYNLVSTTGVVEGVNYWVVNATADTFQVAATQGGSALTLTNDGSATLLPYKQAIITITPQAGQNLTTLNFNILPASKTGLNGYAVNHLDMIVSGTNISNFTLSASSPTVNFKMLERFRLISNTFVTGWDYKFNLCYALQSVSIILRTDVGITTTGMFAACLNLAVAPDMDMSRVTNCNTMFQACYNLVSVPKYDLSNSLNINTMFSGCYSLRTVPAFKLSPSLTSVANMFLGCASLEEVPAFEFTNYMNSAASMFSGCCNLVKAPFLKFPTTGSWQGSSMFSGCRNLQSIPPYDLSRCNDTTGMFQDCQALTSLPWTTLSLPLTSSCAQMFQNCATLESVPDVTVGTSCTAFNSMFNTCYSLQSVGTITMLSTGNYNITTMFQFCGAIRYVNFVNSGVIQTTGAAFNGCAALLWVRWSGASLVTSSTNAIFSSCNDLIGHTPITVAPGTSASNFVNPYGTCYNLRYGGISGVTNNLTLGPIMASSSDLSTYWLDTIGKATTVATTTLTLSTNPGSNLNTASVTANGNTGTVGSTAPLSVGMVAGSVWNGTTTGVALLTTSATVSTSTFTYATAHGMRDGDKIGFSSISTVTGISTYTRYYVVNSTSTTWQVALTPNGSPITLGGTDSASGLTTIYSRVITAIDSGTTFTFSGPVLSATASTWSFRTADIRTPLVQGWTITG